MENGWTADRPDEWDWSPDPVFEVGLIRAYHRHTADFCGAFPSRIKSLSVASTRAVDEALRTHNHKM